MNFDSCMLYICIYFCLDDEGHINIVMEYYGGGNLGEAIRNKREKGEQFTELQILVWLEQLCMALVYLYKNKVIHRDIKPQVNLIKLLCS